jgi:sugar fermentation stimulation protein A
LREEDKKLLNLLPGTTIKRYKRFFMDVQLETGEIVTAHCPNTGPMTSAYLPGWKCLVSHNPDPKRKLKYTIQFTHNGTCWIGVNTHLTNNLVKEALINKTIPELAQYTKIIPEYTYEQSRLDFYLEDETGNKCFVEVKNVSTLAEEGKPLGVFPDTVSTRATKHLETLSKIKKVGYRTVVLFVCQREDILNFSPNFQADPNFSRSLMERVKEGVEVLIYGCKFKLPEITVAKRLDFTPTTPTS